MATDIKGQEGMDSETRDIISEAARQAAHDVFAHDGAVTASNAADAIAAAVTAALDEWMGIYYEVLDGEPEED